MKQNIVKKIAAMVLSITMLIPAVSFYASAEDNSQNVTDSKVTDWAKYQLGGASVKVLTNDSKLTLDPSSLDFGTNISDTKTVTVTNNSEQTLTLEQPVSEYSRFEIGSLSKTVVSPGESATFTVKPTNAHWRPGVWNDDIIIKTDNSDISATLSASFTVTEYPEIKGWLKNANGEWMYYFSDNFYAVGWQRNIPGWEGQWFYFNEHGAMQTSWQNNIPGWQGQWFYFDPSTGVMQTGWKNDIPGWQGQWFYLNKSGVMQTGWIHLDAWYCLAANGVMYADTLTPDGYRVDSNGRWI